ncbi:MULTISPECIES: hypothetical protein [Halorussus]|uniref:hypothetical protein n=1 Tax=Halorussus TaxID=1070314 RepID=UPI000E21532A|nr:MULTISPECIES: hypothetical protein [Halorussus]NHN60819.1 hypothetical protein [Halorussus sp. JP-T4]
MVNELAALDPKELILVLIALMGAVPVAIQYRDQSRWFALGYAMLVIGAISTNLESFVLGEVLNGVEHGVGLMGAALAFAGAAYLRRKNVVRDDEVTPTDA